MNHRFSDQVVHRSGAAFDLDAGTLTIEVAGSWWTAG
jgi:hypothetical protein